MGQVLIGLLTSACMFAAAGRSANPNSERSAEFVAKLNELARQDRDESLNAGPFYARAAKLCVPLLKEVRIQEEPPWPLDWAKTKRLLLTPWIESNHDALNELRLGAERPYYWHHYQGENVWDASLLPHLSGLRCVSDAMTLSVKLCAAQEGGAKSLVNDIGVCLKFSSHLAQAPTLTEQLVGIWTEGHTLDTVFWILARATVNSASSDVLHRSVCEQRVNDAKRRFRLEGEKLKWLDALDLLFNGPALDAPLRPKEEIAVAVRHDLTYEQINALDLRRGRTAEDFEAVLAYCDQVLSMSPWQARTKNLNFWEDVRRLTHENPIVMQPLDNYATVAQLEARRRAKRDALITTLALLRWRRVRGSFPQQLEKQVSANYLAELPMDPYGGAPLVYRRTNDDFILHCLGADFDDDGGSHSRWGRDEEGGDYVFWPVHEGTPREE